MTREMMFAAVAGVCLVFGGCASPQSSANPSPTPSASTAPAAALSPNTKDQQLRVFITAPPNQSKVGRTPTIDGTVADNEAKVWVIVHPTEESDYWVQQPATVMPDRTWKVTIHVGEPDTPQGTRFELRAVANPKVPLSKGQVLSAWPPAQWASQVVEVFR